MKTLRTATKRATRAMTGKGWLDQVMAIDGMVHREEVRALHRLAKQVREGCIVEVGSYRGRSTAALGYGSRAGAGVPVYAIEPHAEFVGIFGGRFGPKDREAFFRSMLATGNWEIVRLVNLSSEIVAPSWREPIGLLWIDGDHTYEGVSRDLNVWLPHLTADATVAFDDAVNEKSGATRLVNELAAGGWTVVERVRKVAVLRRG